MTQHPTNNRERNVATAEGHEPVEISGRVFWPGRHVAMRHPEWTDRGAFVRWYEPGRINRFHEERR